MNLAQSIDSWQLHYIDNSRQSKHHFSLTRDADTFHDMIFIVAHQFYLFIFTCYWSIIIIKLINEQISLV